MKDLFLKYQKPLLKLVNIANKTRYGRKLLNIKEHNKGLKAVKLTDTAVIFDKGNGKFVGDFYTAPVYAKKLGLALTAMDIVGLGDLRALLNYAGLENSFKYPLVAFQTNYLSHDGGTGICYYDNSEDNWNTAHDAAASNSVLATGAMNGLGVLTSAGPTDIRIGRLFLPTLTSALGTGAIVSDCYLYLYLFTTGVYLTSEANDWFVPVGATTQASFTTLATTDYNNCGAIDNPDEWSDDRKDDDTLTNDWHNWEFNQTGLDGISLDSYTPVGMRQAWDITDTTPGSGEDCFILVYAPDEAGKEPYLKITYTPPSGFLVFM